MELKKVDKSGTSSSVVDKARSELNTYCFLFQLDAYLKPGRTRCNLPDNIFDVSNGCDDKKCYEENVQQDEVAWLQDEGFDKLEPVDETNDKKRKPETKA